MAGLFMWDDAYLTGVTIIDDQHKSFVKILNNIYEILQGERNPEALKSALKGVIEYANTHFDTEEEIMKEYNYPGYENHRDVHMGFRKIAQQLEEKLKDKDFMIDFQLLDFLEDWLRNHLQTEDHKYTVYFKEMGIGE